jgi:hypothetical protein
MKTILTLLMLPSLVLANTPLIQGPKTSADEYQKQLYLNPQYFEFVDHLIEKKESSTEQLLSLITDASAADLDRDFDKAKAIYLIISEMALTGEWSEAEVPLFTKAFHRLNEITGNKSVWLNYAMDWQSPFLAKQKVWPTNWDGFTTAIINGRRYDKDKHALPLLRKKFRLSLYSNALQPQTVVLNPNQVPVYRPPAIKLISGDCQSKINSTYLFEEDVVVAFSNCLRNYDKNPNTLSKKANLELKQHSDDFKPKLKSSWLWVGVGIIGGLILYSHQKNQENEGPSTRSGF